MLGDKKANIKIGGDFDPIPMDKYTVQIDDVELKEQFNKFKQEDQELLVYRYVILDEKPMPNSEETTRGRFLWHRVTQNLSPKSWLMKLAQAVYGRPLTREEMEAFDPEALIGKQIDVMVEQKPSADGSTIFNNVVSYSKVVKPLEAWFTDQREKTVIEKTSTPATPPTPQTELPDLDSNFEDAFEESKVEEVLEDDEEVKEEPKAKKSKAKTKNKEAPFPLN